MLEVRGQAVMLDSELALLYGVETGQFNRAMHRLSRRCFEANSPSTAGSVH
jgi:hypothetical protein